MKLIKVKRLFEGNGNAVLILGRCLKAARKAGWNVTERAKFEKEAKSGDYDHLLQTVMKHFEEMDGEDEWAEYRIDKAGG